MTFQVDFSDDILFRYIQEDGNLALRMDFPNEGPADGWFKLVSAIEQGKHYRLPFTETNGEVSIEHEEGFVSFTVMKCGSGYDGASYIDIKASICLETLKKVAQYRLETFTKEEDC